MTGRPSIATCGSTGLVVLVATLEGERSELRRALIFTAGALDNEELLKDLGSMERAVWFEGHRAANPKAINPYWPTR